MKESIKLDRQLVKLKAGIRELEMDRAKHKRNGEYRGGYKKHVSKLMDEVFVDLRGWLNEKRQCSICNNTWSVWAYFKGKSTRCDLCLFEIANKRQAATGGMPYQKYYRSKPEYKARRLQQLAARMESDPIFKFKTQIRGKISSYFRRRGLRKAYPTNEILGCSLDEFRIHIESKFQDGMTWDNYGKWHIDHKKPLRLANTIEFVKELCHYTNLQPLWAVDNLKKGAKY